MPKLLKVSNPSGLRVEGPLLHFDEVVPLKTAVNVIAHAYQGALKAQGIDAEVYSGNTTDTPRFRSYGIYAKGVNWVRTPWPAILFEVVSGEEDGRVYTFTKHVSPDNLEPDKRVLLNVDRGRMFDSYVGRELSDILQQ